MATTSNNRILVIDDNQAIHKDFERILCAETDDGMSTAAALFLGSPQNKTTRATFQLEYASQGQEGVQRLEAAVRNESPFALAFVDMRMPPGWDGLATIEKLWEIDPELQVVICSAYSDHSWDEIQDRIGETDRLLILKKPFDNAEVSQLAVALTEKWRLTRESHARLADTDRQLSVTQDSLNKQRRQLEVATGLAKLGYWEWNVATQSFCCSECAHDIFGVPDQGSFEQEAFLGMFHEADREQMEARLDKAICAGEDFNCKLRVRRPTGEIRFVQIRTNCVGDGADSSTLFGAMQDITDTEHAMMAVQYAALHDPLTNLPNRTKFIESLDTALKRASRDDTSNALVLIDVDRFKDVNDSLGHPVGDGLLMELSRRLQATIRETDTVARLGGDEFAIVQIDVDVPQDSSALLARIYDSMKRPFDINGKKIFATFSAGVAMSPMNGNTVDELMQAADLALYRAKQDGRSVYRFFDESMDQRMQERRQTARDLKATLESEDCQFRLYYQPIIETKTTCITGMEALLRWFHPTRGLVPPDEFISIAEETGSIAQIGSWALGQACKDASQWPAPTTVAVNVSAVQFRQGNLLEAVKNALDESGLEPHRLRLEITETVLLNDTREVLQTLHDIRNLGIHIAMDDFGIGHSSLNSLRSFPFDDLKLDRSFVLASSDKEDAIINAVAGLGASLGMHTCAEGVETIEQFERIRLAGYTHAQGYLFAKPKPVEELLAGHSIESSFQSTVAAGS